MTGASKLRRSEPGEAPAAPCPVDWREGLGELIEGRFYELLEARQWWGASIFGVQGVVPEQALAELAKIGARCACVGARAGAAGYLALIVHPCDSAAWPTRIVSPALGPGKRPPACGLDLLFLPMGSGDFPAPPQIFQTNEALALGAKRAQVERSELADGLGAGASQGQRGRL